MSKVSIIVPIYNTERYLKKCINSILEQTFKDIEIILINDGSTDGSLSICNKYAIRDNRIKVINKKNEGLIATRRRGVEEAKSDYVTFVDSDDWIDNRFVELLYENLIKDNCDIAVCNTFKVIGNLSLIKKKNNSCYFEQDNLYVGDDVKNILAQAYLAGHPFSASMCDKLYKKELLISSGKYLKRIKFLGEDLFYNFEMFLKAKKVKVIKEPLYFYRAGGSTSKYMPYFFEDTVNTYKIQKEIIQEYYKESADKQLRSSSIMFLNTFKTCLGNCLKSELSEIEKKEMIKGYLKNENIIEAINNKGPQNFFDELFLKSVKIEDINYFYNLGKTICNKSKKRSLLIKLLKFM